MGCPPHQCNESSMEHNKSSPGAYGPEICSLSLFKQRLTGWQSSWESQKAKKAVPESSCKESKDSFLPNESEDINHGKSNQSFLTFLEPQLLRTPKDGWPILRL